MNVSENIFFWPGYYTSSLYYVRWNNDLDTIELSLLVEDESVLSNTKNGIVIGRESIKLQRYFSNIDKQRVYSTEEDGQSNLDDVDKTGLVLYSLITKLSKQIKGQFGFTLRRQIPIVILDFYQIFQQKEIRTINALKQYTGHDISLIDGINLLKTAAEKGKLAFDVCIMGDDAVVDQPVIKEGRILFLDINAVIQPITSELHNSAMPNNVSQYAVAETLLKLKGASGNDWVEVSVYDETEDIDTCWLVDKLHVNAHLEKNCSDLVERLNANNRNEIYLVGQYADYLRQFFDTKENIAIKCFSREGLIHQLYSKQLLALGTSSKEKKIDIIIDDHPVKAWEVENSSSKQEITHTLKLFGRNKENVEIELHDEEGRFIQWTFEISTTTSLDICELPIVIRVDSNYNFECVLGSVEEVYISSSKLSLYGDSGSRARQINAREQVISIS